MSSHSIDLILSPFCYFLGYLSGGCAFWWLARRRGLNTVGVASTMAVGLFGGLVFGNIFQFLFTGEAGKTVIGAIAGGYATIIVFKSYIGLTRPLGDLFAFAISAGEAVGRWGCFFGGCCYGKVAHGTFTIWQHNAWRYPTQIYLSLAAALTFAILLTVERKHLLPENGLFYLQGTLFCTLRFIIEFFRVGDTVLYGLTAAQLACLAGLCFFGYKLTTMHSNHHMIAVAQ